MFADIINDAVIFGKEIYHKKSIIYQLTVSDFKNRYIGSSLGFAWTILQPLAMVLILWFIFSVGFKAASVEGVSFAAWLIAGITAWNFFSEALSFSTHVFREYSFLVKKIDFKISILPVVKILSSMILHFINLAILVLILVITGVPVSFYWLQVFYYLGAMTFLLLGLGWITSSLNVFTKDISYILGIILQFGFWLTPIFWDLKMIPSKYHFFFKLNPMWYIVEGYRKSFIFQIPLWREGLFHHLYFWGFCLAMVFLGTMIFKRLKPHFADVL